MKSMTDRDRRRVSSRTCIGLCAVILAVLSLLAVYACKGEPAPAPPAPAPAPPAPPPAPPAALKVTQLADEGAKVFAANCARCHGAQGEGGIGPPIMGESSNLTKYETALKLYEFVSTSMPFNLPGSLSNDEYHRVLAFLLLQNQLISGDATIDNSRLGDITLTK